MDRIRRRPCKPQVVAALSVPIHREGKHPLAFYGTPTGAYAGLEHLVKPCNACQRG
ncbi:MAG: hypothetical protein KDE51_18860 [Anaerolineales bacterium]|nr:hypothetical protein [Anaerolineales bacterium]